MRNLAIPSALVLLFGSGTVLGEVAYANTLPPGQFDIAGYIDGRPDLNFDSSEFPIAPPYNTKFIAYTCGIVMTDCAQANVTWYPTPQIQSYAHGSYVNVATDLLYDFEINGPTGVNVPLIVSTQGAAIAGVPSSYGYTSGFAVLSITDSILPAVVLQREACDFSAGPRSSTQSTPCRTVGGLFPESFSGNYRISLPSDTLGTAGMYMQLVNTQDGPGAYTTGFVDPIITIDPSFPDASEYSLTFSPYFGDGPASQIPEPSSLGLFLTSLIGLAWIRRRAAALIRTRRGVPDNRTK
jgi:hypothetical protein